LNRNFQIPRLPTGIAYFVRIKVLGKNGKILVETPEIRARNEMLAGIETKFDVHRQTVTHPSVSVTSLLPGTEYQVRVRAADRLRVLGPWNDYMLVAKTEGEAPNESDEIDVDYRTDSEIRISWQPFDDERLQHYEVIAVEVDGETQTVERARISPLTNSHVFVRLKPDTEYDIGVVAFVDHEPKLVYKLPAKTAETSGLDWKEKPVVVPENEQQFTVQWKKPLVPDETITKFVIEYRLPNETEFVNFC
uniref:Fibronectin type-III domain-containing protein n=1 Tax=Onchocerca flexuosa TaxID=387005 RepID=A0A183I7B4_9BILA